MDEPQEALLPMVPAQSDDVRKAGEALMREVLKATADCDFELEPASFIVALEKLAGDDR